MNYVLDTNIILVYLKDEQFKAAIEAQYDVFSESNNPIISVVTIGEIRSIALQNNWGAKRIEFVEQFLKEFVVIDVRYNDLINTYAEIDAFSQGKFARKPLGTSSRNMGKNDLWIAATAHIMNAQLITMDKDFQHLDKEYFEVIYLSRT